MRIVLHPPESIAAWVCLRIGGPVPAKQMTAIGIADGRRLVAGTVFDAFIGTRINCAVTISERAATPLLARAIARYAFVHLQLPALTLACEAGNIESRLAISRLGAIPEGILEGASRSGDDILISRLPRDSYFVKRILGCKAATRPAHQTTAAC